MLPHVLISTQVKFTLGNLFITLINYKFTPGNSTKGNLTLDNITLGNPTLAKYTLLQLPWVTLLQVWVIICQILTFCDKYSVCLAGNLPKF